MLQLKKFPDIPVSTQEEARGSRPHPEEPRFRLLVRDQGSFPCFVGKEFPAFPSHLKRTHSPQKVDRNSRVVPPSKSPLDVTVHSRGTCFPCTIWTFMPWIDSHHSGTWHSPFRRHHGKASFETSKDSPDPLIHATGSVTLQLQHGFKAPAYAPTRDVD